MMMIKEITYKELYDKLVECINKDPEHKAFLALKVKLKWPEDHPYAKKCNLNIFADIERSEYEKPFDILITFYDDKIINFASCVAFSLVDYFEIGIQRIRMLYIGDTRLAHDEDGHSFWVKEFDLNDSIGKSEDIVTYNNLDKNRIDFIDYRLSLLYGLYNALINIEE